MRMPGKVGYQGGYDKNTLYVCMEFSIRRYMK